MTKRIELASNRRRPRKFSEHEREQHIDKSSKSIAALTIPSRHGTRPQEFVLMNSPSTRPAPFLAPDDVIVLFDGTCKLCNGWAQFVIEHDRAHRMKLAAVQSAEGQALLKWAGLPQDKFNTIVLIAHGEVFIRSEAMFQIMARLPAPWCWLTVARVVPGALRDWLYDKIALNRYRLFGRYDACRLPPADHDGRFLEAEG
jgi:predicted DCC family thiol-disulfide oxidoreductase YuxK